MKTLVSVAVPCSGLETLDLQRRPLRAIRLRDDLIFDLNVLKIAIIVKATPLEQHAHLPVLIDGLRLHQQCAAETSGCKPANALRTLVRAPARRTIHALLEDRTGFQPSVKNGAQRHANAVILDQNRGRGRYIGSAEADLDAGRIGIESILH